MFCLQVMIIVRWSHLQGMSKQAQTNGQQKAVRLDAKKAIRLDTKDEQDLQNVTQIATCSPVRPTFAS
jgi:hypothetical protein